MQRLLSWSQPFKMITHTHTLLIWAMVAWNQPRLQVLLNGKGLLRQVFATLRPTFKFSPFIIYADRSPITNTTSKTWGSNRKLPQEEELRENGHRQHCNNFRSVFTSGHLLAYFAESTHDKTHNACETWGGLSFLLAQAIKFLIAGDRAAFESHLHWQKR